MDFGGDWAVRYHEQVLLMGRLHERCCYWRLIKSDSYDVFGRNVAQLISREK